MDFFKYFDWPRKSVSSGSGGGNIVQIGITAQQFTSSGNKLFATAAIRSSGRPVEINAQNGLASGIAGCVAVYPGMGGINNLEANFSVVRNGVPVFIVLSMVPNVGAASILRVPYSIINFKDVFAPEGLNTYEFYVGISGGVVCDVGSGTINLMEL